MRLPALSFRRLSSSGSRRETDPQLDGGHHDLARDPQHGDASSDASSAAGPQAEPHRPATLGGDDASTGQATVVPDETTLDLVPVGGQADVVRIGGHKAVKRRLMEMGLVRGERVRVQRVAPLGDPIELRVKGYHLAVRRSEARSVVVTVPRDSLA